MKFKVGDKARVVYTCTGEDNFWRTGAIVTIHNLTIKVNPRCGSKCDLSVMDAGGDLACPRFDQLEPITEQKTTWEEVQSITQWNPQKVKV